MFDFELLFQRCTGDSGQGLLCTGLSFRMTSELLSMSTDKSSCDIKMSLELTVSHCWKQPVKQVKEMLKWENWDEEMVKEDP